MSQITYLLVKQAAPIMLMEEILTSISYVIWSLSNIFTMIPFPKKDVTITYTLYSPDNPNPTIIDSIDELTINPDYKLKILCHSWVYTNYSTQWYNNTVQEYMKKGGITVITANYTYAIINANYYTTIMYANHIGTQIGKFILKLNEVKGAQFDDVHILGHLLGAHIAGVAGKTVYKETGKYIDRITGIDPVNFGMVKFFTDGRLTRNDAAFVDVIHASTGFYQDSIGRIDFIGYPYTIRCSYNWRRNLYMGPVFYANSINNVREMVGTKCLKKNHYFYGTHCNENVTATLGEYVDRSEFGKFYLKESDINDMVCNERNVETTTISETVTTEVVDE